MELDKWDCKLVRACKRRETSMDDLRDVWAERCNLELQYVQNEHVVLHMWDLVRKFNLANEHQWREMLVDAQPRNEWKFGLVTKGTSHWEMWAKVLASLLRNTEVVRLPGYGGFCEREALT